MHAEGGGGERLTTKRRRIRYKAGCKGPSVVPHSSPVRRRESRVAEGLDAYAAVQGERTGTPSIRSSLTHSHKITPPKIQEGGKRDINGRRALRPEEDDVPVGSVPARLDRCMMALPVRCRPGEHAPQAFWHSYLLLNVQDVREQRYQGPTCC